MPTENFNQPFAQSIQSQGQKNNLSPVDVAEVVASKELGRLAVYINREFSHLIAEGKSPVDIAIELLETAYRKVSCTVEIPVEHVIQKEL